MDDNAEILRLVQERLALGRQRYGHGVRVDDDVSKFTSDGSNEWETMMLEEALDGMVYAAACMIRVKRQRMNSLAVTIG
jgi:phage terminase large subunit GpA-like protein